jgi:hypothetical protein
MSGAWIVAEYLAVELRAVGYRDDQKRTLVDSPRLRHARAANRFLTPDDPRFAVGQRSLPGCGVAGRGMARKALATACPARRVRPPRSPNRVLELVLELDLGRRTEAG